MSFFGGAQMFQIMINLVRGKFVALLLGPEGMGISSLLTASSNTIQQLASFGIPTAIVKELSGADQEDNSARDAIIASARHATRITALTGAIICMAFSVFISRWTFGDDNFTWQYMLLSIAVLFGILGSGEMSILQGLRQVKRLSWSSVVGASTGLAIGVPLYYIWGNGGIVPAMIAVSLAAYIFYRISISRTAGIANRRIDHQVRLSIMRKLLALGSVLMAGSLIGTCVTYLSNAFIRYIGGIDDVGYFQAANSITNQYAGVIFAAMSVDYFPRLAAVASDNVKVTEIVNRQTEIIALIMAPLMILLMLTAPVVIRIQLTEEFINILPLVYWLGTGVFLRALAYPPGYIAFAKSNKRLFFLLEGIFGNALYLTANCTCYYIWGLTGLGAAMCATYMISLAVYYAVNRRLYSYTMRRSTFMAILPLFISVTAALASTYITSSPIYYTTLSAIFTATATYSAIRLLKALNK